MSHHNPSITNIQKPGCDGCHTFHFLSFHDSKHQIITTDTSDNIHTTATTTPVIQDLVDELLAAGIIVNRGKSSALPPPGHKVTHEERRLLGEAGLPIAGEGITVVGVPVGKDDFVKNFAADVITKGGAGKLARMLARMPNKQVAHLITSMSLVQRLAYIERGIDHKLVSGACERLDNLVMCVLEAGMGLRNADDEDQLFEDDHQPDRFK